MAENKFIGRPEPNVEHKAPLLYSILGGLSVDKSVFIRFRTNDDCQRFDFNFVHPNGIAFHFNPRPNEGVVVMNSKGDEWEAEERAECPFTSNRLYGVQIKVCEDHYAVYLTGNELWRFKHRIPFSEVKELMIKGEISVEDVVFDGGEPQLNPAVANHSDQVLNPAVEKFE